MAENPVASDEVKRESADLARSQKGTAPEGRSGDPQGAAESDPLFGHGSAKSSGPDKQAAGD